MATRRTGSLSNTAIYLIAALVILLAFLILGGGSWMRGIMHGNGIMSISGWNWNWTQTLVTLGFGFLLGFIVARRT